MCLLRSPFLQASWQSRALRTVMVSFMLRPELQRGQSVRLHSLETPMFSCSCQQRKSWWQRLKAHSAK